MVKELRWGGGPGYSQETGMQPAGKFLHRPEVDKELRDRGIEEGVPVMLLDGSGPWIVGKTKGGRIPLTHKTSGQTKEVGLGAIETVLKKPV